LIILITVIGVIGKKFNRIKFDDIAFIVASNNFVKEEIQPLKDQEN
jgi:hypothetical protein